MKKSKFPKNLTIIDKLWFNNPTMMAGEIVGIIIAKDTMTGKIDAYIGKGVTGETDADTIDILKWGTKIDREVLRSMI